MHSDAKMREQLDQGMERNCCGRGLGEVSRSRALSFVYMIQVRSLQRTESSQAREEPVARALLKFLRTLLPKKGPYPCNQSV